MNNPKQFNYAQQLEHRLQMIMDDMHAIRQFINENELDHVFQKPTIHADECYTHFNNIEIACNINDDESLSWGILHKTLKN
jgi:hypothetical protein